MDQDCPVLARGRGPDPEDEGPSDACARTALIRGRRIRNPAYPRTLVACMLPLFILSPTGGHITDVRAQSNDSSVANLSPCASSDIPRLTLTRADSLRFTPYDAYSRGYRRFLVTSDRIYILRQSTRSVEIYDRAGHQRESIPNLGPGPLGPIGIEGDQLYVVDSRRRATRFFTLDGTPAGESDRIARPGWPYSPTVPQFSLADGSLLVRPSFPTLRAYIGMVGEVPVFRVNRDGSIRDTIHRVPHMARHIRIASPGMVTYVPNPFMPSELWNVSMDGAWGAFLSWESSERGAVVTEVALWDFKRGARHRIAITLPSAPPMVADSAALRLLSEALGVPPDSVRATAQMPRFSGGGLLVPPAVDLRVGEDGSVFIGMPMHASGMLRWYRLHPNDGCDGYVDIDPTLEMTPVSRQELWLLGTARGGPLSQTEPASLRIQRVFLSRSP